MQHSFKEFLRKGGTGQYIVFHRNGAVYGGRAAPSIKAQLPHYAEIREAFAAQLDSAINDNTRMLLNALTPPDTAPWVTAPDLRDVNDAKEDALRQWDARFSLIFDEYETHPQRIRPLQASMEERLLRAFAGLINQLRQNDLGIERYIWRSRDDAKVRNSHAEHDDQVFRWDQMPKDGRPDRRIIVGALQSLFRRMRQMTRCSLIMCQKVMAIRFKTLPRMRLEGGTQSSYMLERAKSFYAAA